MSTTEFEEPGEVPGQGTWWLVKKKPWLVKKKPWLAQVMCEGLAHVLLL